MVYLLGIAAALVGIYVALWLAVAGFLWLLVPALIIVLPALAVCGVLLALVVAARTLVTRGLAAPEVITPRRVEKGKAGLPELRHSGAFGRDRAWPVYFAAQARTDLGQVWREIRGAVWRGWAKVGTLFRYRGYGWIPGLVVVCPLWLSVSLGAFAAGAAVLAAGALVLFALWVPWVLTAGFLRGTDQLVRRLRGASGSCPRCYHVDSLPAFACPGCGRLHRDIRPGRLGAVWRRCDCGRRLPTTVLRMARIASPQCPRCKLRLRDGAAVLTDIRIPVFGPVSAGKTRLVYAGLVALRDAVAAAGGTLGFVDDDSKAAFDHGAAIITSGGDTVKTPAGELPTALTVRYDQGRRSALLHLFDAAGEFYADRDDNSMLEFLDHAQGLVFVVDPFSVPWVRDQAGTAEVLARANPAVEDPERVYHVTAQRLRDYGVRTRKRKLAMTIVKADLLDGVSGDAAPAPGDGRDWLVRAGLDNLVLSAERDFGEVRYFVVASVAGKRAGSGFSPANPLAWLAAGAGAVMLPEQSGRDGSREVEETV
ncbi:hypothetical protein ORV05_23205 [Amycolatopsis cynarae]|uniref:Double-GTPase 2 domain-containing protein n=1 Tax=Amycolatopsis cynarae TaxID=2995223 RepID=A0ABY7AW18_9PSEU|nr:hypothetical protein [Amycolatopsis sp. HUAS 11-8]WAL63890.1 hypothetical protein ORV05_23205 [Amycolatopsis sp. HUAS 11-8]